jgi:predicted unusual protein kinase regulating ubiquinone biosynthesis (AarF/ABC1/UbiB family)
VFASAERRVELDRERELKTAEAVAERLGNMKGALMKLGQMASYVDEGLPAPLREALAQLQSNAPPMSAELAAQVIERSLGAPPEQLFVEWDPQPIAAASIGQVHRAVIIDPATGQERAVAVKVQYPGVGEAVAADLRNADLLGMLLQQGFGGLDPDEMVAEVKERLIEELDYRLEARNQQHFADFYRGHPFIHVPDVCPSFSSEQVITSELVDGATLAADAAVAAGPSATESARCCSASCSAASTASTRSTATRTPATICSTATAASPSSTSAW